MGLIKQVTLDRANRKKDRSVSLTFITQLEQSSSEFMELDEMLNSSGLIYFTQKGILTEEEIKTLDEADISVEGKTKSQRLRNVLYIYHQQNSDLDFKDFYAKEMDRIIEHYKNKLNNQ